MSENQSTPVNVLDAKYGQPVCVPLKIATDDVLEEYGRIVRDFEAEEVWIEQWPAQGTRPLSKESGRRAGVIQGDFRCHWEGDQVQAASDATEYTGYLTGRLPADVSPEDRTHVLVWKANYHPDAGQVFYPKNGDAFVFLLARPGDDVKPEDFVAFYFDGSFGFQIKPNVWHMPVYPLSDSSTFINKQGAVFGVVNYNSVEEVGTVMRVPLKPCYAQ